MFKFGFNNTNDNNDETEEDTEVNWLESKEHKIDENLNQLNDLICNPEGIHNLKCEFINIKYILADYVVQMIKDKYEALSVAEKNHSDLVTAVYEGGLKIWECTYDLLNKITEDKMTLKNKNILDLGCGAGILGIMGLVNGANVYFQDYNPEVIKYITIPNVLLNKDVESAKSRCKFYSGDWLSFLDITEEDCLDDCDKFDFIFTSETIYNPNNYNKLVKCFKKMLKKSGSIYLAAKTYYFGVGGSLRDFEDLLKKEEIFDYSTCWESQTGLKREIIKITFKT